MCVLSVKKNLERHAAEDISNITGPPPSGAHLKRGYKGKADGIFAQKIDQGTSHSKRCSATSVGLVISLYELYEAGATVGPLLFPSHEKGHHPQRI
jgi:hypothetical protein